MDAPTGLSPRAIKEALAARARGPAPGAGAGDALTGSETAEQAPLQLAARVPPAGPADDARAALERRCERSLGREALQAWLDAEDAFLAQFPAGERLASLAAVGRLWRALRRIEHYDPGHILGDVHRRLATYIAGHAEMIQKEPGEWVVPRSVAYWIPRLEAEGRRLKHAYAPRLKDQRIAEGKRRPRRKPGNPGRGGPAVGRDPRTDPPPRNPGSKIPPGLREHQALQDRLARARRAAREQEAPRPPRPAPGPLTGRLAELEQRIKRYYEESGQ